MIFLCTKILFIINSFKFLFHRRKYNPLPLSVLPLSHMASCTTNKSNLYFSNSLANVCSDTDLLKIPQILLSHSLISSISFHLLLLCIYYATHPLSPPVVSKAITTLKVNHLLFNNFSHQLCISPKVC